MICTGLLPGPCISQAEFSRISRLFSGTIRFLARQSAHDAIIPPCLPSLIAPDGGYVKSLPARFRVGLWLLSTTMYFDLNVPIPSQLPEISKKGKEKQAPPTFSAADIDALEGKIDLLVHCACRGSEAHCLASTEDS